MRTTLEKLDDEFDRAQYLLEAFELPKDTEARMLRTLGFITTMSKAYGKTGNAGIVPKIADELERIGADLDRAVRLLWLSESLSESIVVRLGRIIGLGMVAAKESGKVSQVSDTQSR